MGQIGCMISKYFVSPNCINCINIWPTEFVQTEKYPLLRLPWIQAKCSEGPFWISDKDNMLASLQGGAIFAYLYGYPVQFKPRGHFGLDKLGCSDDIYYLEIDFSICIRNGYGQVWNQRKSIGIRAVPLSWIDSFKMQNKRRHAEECHYTDSPRFPRSDIVPHYGQIWQILSKTGTHGTALSFCLQKLFLLKFTKLLMINQVLEFSKLTTNNSCTGYQMKMNPLPWQMYSFS